MRLRPAFIGMCAGTIWLAGATVHSLAQQSGSGVENPSDDRERSIMERFLGILEKTPKRGTALDRVYGYHVERGTLDSFVKKYQDQVAKDPKDGGAWLLLGLLEAQRGRDAASVTALRTAEQLRPDDPLCSYYLGQALVLVGQPDAAAAAFERAIERKPSPNDSLEIHQALGRVYQRAHQTDKALDVWNRLERQFPNDLRVQEQIAAALAEESQPELALPRYEALARKTADAYRKTQFRLDAAELKIRLGKSADALADFESLLAQLNPESWLYREVRRKIEDVFLRNDDQAGLTKYYETWLKKTPDDVDAMARLARNLSLEGRVADAQSWFDKAVKLAPKRKELRLALVEQLTQEKKFAEAAAQYEALAKTDANNPDYIREWGRLLLLDTTKPEPERKKNAAAVWRKLVEARPKDPTAAAQAADLLRQAELSDDAIALYKKAIELAPDSPQYYEYLGEYYHNLKRSADAISTWSNLASGKNKNAKNLSRLAEVLSGFGYKTEALAAIGEACALAADEFDYRIQQAELFHQLDRFDDAIASLDAAETLADDAEQEQQVLELQVKNYQAGGTLAKRAESLKSELDSGKNPTPARWLRLARLLEADGKLPESVAAINAALKLDAKSAPAHLAAARVHEAAGNLGAAADAYRKLGELDRRARTEYLTQVAKLETRLGRKEQALRAGRDLLAAAPGNPDSYQFFADLCFQLGENDEGFDALRRAVRVNPNDAKAMLSLAETLGGQFRTEEAIELFWRAFDKATDFESKLGIVARLTSLYLQRNQFDRLVARLEREGREANQQREATICLAQAYSASGDYGTARQTLERLLGANARDTQLLGQLVALSESEGDVGAAAKFQKQLNEVAPSEDGSTKLAQLYVRTGEIKEAEAIWTGLASKQDEPHRILQAIDSLLGHMKYDAAIAIAEKLVLKNPGDWEALYREGVALANVENKRDLATRKFRAVLALAVRDDEQSVIAKARRKNTPGRPAGASASRRFSEEPPPEARAGQATQIRVVSGLESRYYYGGSGSTMIFAPDDFGQARMACLAWLFQLASKDDRKEEFLKEQKAAREKAGADSRTLWDWEYLSLVRQELRESFDAAKALAVMNPTDPEALLAFLNALPYRSANPGVQVYRRASSPTEDKTPALPAADLEFVLKAYQNLRQRRPDWVRATVLTNVAKELKRAKRTDEATQLYQQTVNAAATVESVTDALALAAERGDVDGALALFDKHERLQSKRSARAPGMGMRGNPTEALAKLVAARGADKAHADILRILDHYLAAQAQERDAKSTGPKKRPYSSPFGNQNYVLVYNYQGSSQRYIEIAYPEPNDYLDYGAIELLRNAFEQYKRADLVSDLIAHFSARLAEGTTSRRVLSNLALGALSWWNDDRDEALKRLEAVVALLPGESSFKLELASLRELRGERDEALALVDSIEPLDNQTMQQRETLALRLSVLTGNVDRARQAAERLFNLRLDTDTQVQLAAQMHQLGMHELAEAVMGRARRRAGNRTAALTALMAQYQRQNKLDVAIQVAHQILRKSPARSANPNGNSAEDNARVEAIHVLARSGKIRELIDRAEAQLKASPGSSQLLQTLADYYEAAGDQEKMKATYNRIAELNPDDARLRFQVAQHLTNAGDNEGAVAHYKVAIKKEPSLFAQRYWEVQNAFQAANKFDELVGLIESIDIAAMGNYWTVTNLVQVLLQDDKTKGKGLALFRKAWKAFPADRANLLGNFYDESIWRMPEMLDYAREAIMPSDSATSFSAWAGVDSIISYNGDGRVNTVLSRLIESASGQGKLNTIASEIEAKLKQFPEWSGGTAILAVLRARQGKISEAKSLLEQLLQSAKTNAIAPSAAWAIGQELEEYGPMRSIAESLYREALKDTAEDGLIGQYQYSPARRLVELYKKENRPEAARKLLRKYAARKPGDSSEPWQISQDLQTMVAVAQEYANLGFPGDAVKLYKELSSNEEAIQSAQQYDRGEDWAIGQVDTGFKSAIRGLKGKSLDTSLANMLALNAVADAAKSDRPPLDLVLFVSPRNLDRAAVVSFFGEAMKKAASDRKLLDRTWSQLKALTENNPKDFAIATATVLAASVRGDSKEFAETVERLAKLVAGTPLEPLAPGVRANARQRKDAEKQLALWLAARACWASNDAAVQKAGEMFSQRALDAAKRQLNSSWSLAMLRERGQRSLDHGDKAAAERDFARMLDSVLANPLADKPPANDAAAAAPAAAIPATPAISPCAPPRGEAPANDDRGSAFDAKSKRRRDASFALLASSMLLAPIAQAPAKAQVKARIAAPPTGASTPRVIAPTIDRFAQAAELAKLAAKKGMIALSLRAVRQSLQAGPPVSPMEANQRFGARSPRMMMVTTATSEPNQDPIAAQVENELSALDRLWRKANAPPAEVYETLVAAVLPESRPGEVFLYMGPLQQVTAVEPTSAGARLVFWAVRAEKADDLRKRIEARKDQPMAELPALVLLAQLARESGDIERAKSSFAALGERLKKDSLAATADLACHAALPALENPNLRAAAIAVVEQAAKNLGSGQVQQEPLSSLLIKLARHHFDHNEPDEAKKRLQDLASASERIAVGNAEYSSYMRKHVTQQIAAEFARAGLVGDALDALGQFSDIPVTRYGSPGDADLAPLVRMLAAKPAAERYDLLRTWTLPRANRKSVRILAGTVPVEAPPAAFGSFPIVETKPGSSDSSGVVSTAGLLIAAARESGKLDALATEVKPLVDSKDKVENAATLALLIHLARGQADEAEPAIKTLREQLKKRWANSEDNANNRSANRPAENAIDFEDYLVAHAAARDPKLGDLGEAMLRDILDQARKIQDWQFQGLILHDVAQRAARRPMIEPAFAHWSSTMNNAAAINSPNAWWVEHEDVLLHPAGRGDDFLLLDYPLTGTFTIEFDAYDGAWAEGDASYGGLTFAAMGSGTPGEIVVPGQQARERIQTRSLARERFNHYKIDVSPTKIRCSINGHLFYETTDPSPVCPWFAFHTKRERRAAWRDLRVSGEPKIPREVVLCQNDRVEGWLSHMYGESVLTSWLNNDKKADDSQNGSAEDVEPAAQVDLDANDWFARDGVLHGNRGGATAGTTPTPSAILHMRPLRDGETLSYEFFYEPGVTEAHPIIGRVALLLAPEGTRLRWLVNESDWTGLKFDNSVPIPGNDASAKKPLPLKPGAWNAAALRVRDGKLAFELNQSLVAEIPLEPANSRRFGFYHDKARTETRIRKIVLRGDWPAELPKDLWSQRAGASPIEAKTASALVGEHYESLQTDLVLSKAARLDPPARYSYLASFVLPSDTHPTGFRLYGHFSETDPSPIARPAATGSLEKSKRGHSPASLQSPALELIKLAKSLDKLGELREAIAAIAPANDRDRRDRLALLALVEIARETDDAALSRLKELEPLLATIAENAPASARWAEFLVAHEAVSRPSLLPITHKLLDFMVVQQIQKKSPGPDWENHVRHLRAVAQLQASSATPPVIGADPALSAWQPVILATAERRAQGYALPHWSIQNGEAKHYPGFDHDYLYFQTPLRGDFELTCELTGFDWREARISYAGLQVGLNYDRKKFDVEHYGRFLPPGTIDPPLPEIKDWYDYKLVVKDGTYTVFLLGRKIFEQSLPAGHDPWLALHVGSSLTGGARNLRITGSPVVPEAIDLSSLSDLSGWVGAYYGESVGTNSDWEKRAEEIVGRRTAGSTADAASQSRFRVQNEAVDEVSNSFQESVLQYHRPLLEDGHIEYEFYYAPGASVVHPALDRLTFLLDPGGVKIHWLTDSPHDRTGVSPDNSTVEAAARRGPEKLPLKPDGWNKLRLEVAGDVVTITLNDTVVCERTLEPINQRTFGLFHWSDQSEARVRNIIYRGAWPKEVPKNHELVGKNAK